MEDTVIEVNESQFDRLLDTDRPVVVEFYTNSCPVCAAMGPVLSDIAAELKDTAVFAKVDVQENQALAIFHGVMGVPTFIFFCRGEIKNVIVGEVNPSILKKAVRDAAECEKKDGVFELDGYS